VLPTLLYALPMLLATLFKAATDPRATSAAISAYSIKSWPDSSSQKALQADDARPDVNGNVPNIGVTSKVLQR